MLVLGIDPGLRATGFGFVEGSHGGVSLLQTGLIRTDEGVGLPARLHAIHQQLIRLLELHHPSLVAVEDIYAALRYPRTAIIMGHVRGIVCLAAAERRIEVLALPPASVKQAIAGFGAASKGQIQQSVGRLLGLARPLDRHVADAVAMALTALSREGQVLQRAEAHLGGRVPRESGRAGALTLKRTSR